MTRGPLWSATEVGDSLRLPYPDFARAHPGRSYDSWAHHRIKARHEAPAPPEPPVEPDPVDTELRRRVDARQAQLLEQEVSREIASRVTEQARHESVLRCLEANMARMPVPDIVPHPIDAPGTPEMMVALVSDPHVGKLVGESFVGEGFAYDRYAFHERCDRWERTLLKLQAIHEQAYPVRRLVLLFLGDIVDGVDMRRGHGLRVDINSAVKQALMASRAFAEAITRLSAHFDEIDVDWVSGNHGRIGDFGVAVSIDNWDHVCGLMLQSALTSLPNVTVRIRTQYHDVVQIGPLTAYLSHGASIRGGGGFGGIPFYGIMQGAAKDTGLHQRIFDLYAIGHFHQAVMLPYGATTIMVNGAWDGGDDFSVNQLKKASAPIQWAMGVHPSRGMTWYYPILMTDAARPPTPVHEIA